MQTAKRGYEAYQEAHAHELDQAKLILMMFAGAVRFLSKVIESAESDPGETDRYISKTKKILLELISSLDIENSGEMGDILLRAYRGLFLKLTAAQIQHDMRAIGEVRTSLIELEDSWKQVFSGLEYQMFVENRDHARLVFAGK